MNKLKDEINFELDLFWWKVCGGNYTRIGIVGIPVFVAKFLLRYKKIITVGVEILFVNKKKKFLKKVGLGQNFLKTILYEPQVF